MKKLTFAKSLAAVGLAAVCVVGVAGCSDANSASSEGSGETTYTGGVAATVNGAEIQEDTVTQSIQNIREQMGVTDEQSWGEWLAQYDYTPESVREEIINTYVDQELLKQGAAAQEITADEGEVNQYIEQMRSNYDSDEKWNEALTAVGMTEDEYRENIELSLVTQQLKTNLAAEAGDPTDDEVLETAKSYASSYSGAKKSSHILFDAADEDQAKEVLEKVRSGELDFAEAAKTYSKDTGSAEDGGNVGWDKLSNFVSEVSEYATVLEGLEKDQISDLVSSERGLHIIKCTDVFTAPEELTSLDQLPTEFQDAIRSMVKSSKESQTYYTWLKEQREAADVKINDMPEGLPYYVDMTKYAKDDDEAADATEGDADASTDDEAAEGDAAEGDQQAAEGTEKDAAEGDAAEGVEGAEGDAAPADGADADAAADQQSAEGDASAGGDQPAEATEQPAEAPAAE